MAELTISDLRNLETAESSLLFAVDGDTETFNLTLNTLFEYTKDRLGYLETGAIEMYMGEVIPDTHTELDGKSFDPLVFPKMGALFPAGTLPDTRGMTLKHAPDGRSVLSFEGEAVKSHTHTASQASHSHTRGSMNITGSLSTPGALSPKYSGAFSLGAENGSGDVTKQSSNGREVSFSASRTWTGSTSSQTPAITVSASGSAKNLVDNIAVKFIIKKA